MKAFLRALWTPTSISPHGRTRINVGLHRAMIVLAAPLTVVAYVFPRPGLAVLMALSVTTQLTGTYGNTQIGDVREKEDQR